MKGTIKWFSIDKRYGFVIGEDGIERYVGLQDLQGAEMARPGSPVAFQDVPGVQKPRAIQVRVLPQPIGSGNDPAGESGSPAAQGSVPAGRAPHREPLSERGSWVLALSPRDVVAIQAAVPHARVVTPPQAEVLRLAKAVCRAGDLAGKVNEQVNWNKLPVQAISDAQRGLAGAAEQVEQVVEELVRMLGLESRAPLASAAPGTGPRAAAAPVPAVERASVGGRNG